MTSRSVIYARQSLDRSGEGAAIERQVADCRALAVARGWDVVEVVSDNDMSASSGKLRPGYERVLAMIEARSVDRVIVWAVDRLTRRMRDLEDVVDLCERSGVSVATVSGDIDLGTDMGRMVARILASVARGEVERKGARQVRANLQRAQAGNVGWTRRPFGYARAGGRVVVVEDEAAALQLAAQRVLEGVTLASAARDLDAKGLRTTAGKPWNVTSLRRALLNPRYAGRAVSKGEDHGAGAWPVIIDAATQERLEDVLRDVRRRMQQGTEVKHLLSGLARCGKCGSVMFGSPLAGANGRRWQGYKCSGPRCYLARRADLVDEVVEGTVIARLQLPDAAALFAPDADLDALRAEATTLRERRDTLADLYADGLITAAKARATGRAVADRLRAVEANIEAASTTSPLAALTTAQDVRAVWATLPVRKRRDVIDALTEVTILPSGKGIRFSPEHVQITWRQS